MPETWEIQHAPWAMHRGSALSEALDAGWEPFGVTEVANWGATIWLRRVRPEPAPDPPLAP